VSLFSGSLRSVDVEKTNGTKWYAWGYGVDEAIAFVTHGLCVAFLLLQSQQFPFGSSFILISYFGFAVVPLAIIYGLKSIPTAILSLLLIGVVVTAPHSPLTHSYIGIWFIIVGYRIYRVLMRRGKRRSETT